ncbi:MAG: hypothetical protein HYY04_02680 [Chloroflexi bacterium]|nr:hypothetical protein [Chloroflexota bacterium]
MGCPQNHQKRSDTYLAADDRRPVGGNLFAPGPSPGAASAHVKEAQEAPDRTAPPIGEVHASFAAAITLVTRLIQMDGEVGRRLDSLVRRTAEQEVELQTLREHLEAVRRGRVMRLMTWLHLASGR